MTNEYLIRTEEEIEAVIGPQIEKIKEKIYKSLDAAMRIRIGDGKNRGNYSGTYSCGAADPPPKKNFSISKYGRQMTNSSAAVAASTPLPMITFAF